MDNQPTIDRVRQLLAVGQDGSIEGGRLTLDSQVLLSLDPAGLIGPLLQSAFGGNAAVLNNASANPQGQGSELIINGRCGCILGNALQTCLTLSLDDNQQVQLLFAFQMIGPQPAANPWRFSQSFPAMPIQYDYQKLGKPQGPALDDLQLFNSLFYVTTRAIAVGAAALQPGINFVSELRPNGLFSLFLSLVPSTAPLLLHGTVNVPATTAGNAPALAPGQFPWSLSGVPYGINLSLSLALPALNLGSALSAKLELLRFYSPHSIDWLGRNPDYQPVVAWSGMFEVPSASLHVPVTVLTPPGSSEVELIADLSGTGQLPGLAALADLTGSSDLLQALPKGWSQPSGIGLQSVALLLGLEHGVPKVQRASLSVAISQQRWTIWDPYFIVDSIQVAFTVDQPFHQPQVGVRIDGELQICDQRFKAMALKNPEYLVSLSLADKVDLPLNRLMSRYLDGISPPSDLTIDSLSFCAAPGRYYSLMLGMAQEPNPWTIDIGITRLRFSDIQLFALRSSQGGISGSFSGTAQIAGLTLNARYDIPGNVLIRADLPPTDLRTLVSGLSGGLAVLPGSFNLSFSQSYILLQKQNNDYLWEMGTLISDVGSLAFVVKRAGGQWGFAIGLDISMAQVGQLQGVGSTIGDFAQWFPFDNFVLAASSLKDSQFAFPGFQQFDQSSLGNSKIQLPASVQGIDKGFYLYTQTTFTRKNRVLGALIDLLDIPEGTQLQAMVSYLSDKQQLQLGISLTTFITPLADTSKRTCQGTLGYQNGCLSGTLFAQVAGGGNLSLGLSASLKTRIQDTDVAFTLILAVVENGLFVSGTMDNQQPLAFGPLKLGGLAVELGISFEGVPSFGFAGELDVAGAFDSSLAVLVDSANPGNSMIAAALSDLVLGDVLRHLLGPLDVPVPAPFFALLDTIRISGTRHGSFNLDGADAKALANALDNFDGQVISRLFIQYGKLKSFPSSSEGLMLFVDTPGRQWYLTEKSGSASNSTICHWQLSRRADGSLQVSKEAQLYFVPNSAGSRIGTFYYPQGMLIAGRIDYLFISLDLDIELIISKGIKVNAELDKVVLGTERLFSLTSEDGQSGAKLSLASFDQPLEPVGLQKPHFLVTGKLQLLGISRGVSIKIDESGATFILSGDLVPNLVRGKLNGSIGQNSILDVSGKLFAGIGDIDLGSLGNWAISSGVTAAVRLWAKASDLGATLNAGFELAGTAYNLPAITLDIATQSLADLASILFDKVKAFLIQLFGDPKAWAELANKVLAWTTEQISSVLGTVFGLDEAAIKGILGTLCPMATALSIL